MVDLVVKDLDDAIVRALRRRAGIHGRSEEAEHRAILAAWLPMRRALSAVAGAPTVARMCR